MTDYKPQRAYAADDKTLGFSLAELSQILADATALTFSRERTHLQLGQSGGRAGDPIAFVRLVEEPAPAEPGTPGPWDVIPGHPAGSDPHGSDHRRRGVGHKA